MADEEATRRTLRAPVDTVPLAPGSSSTAAAAAVAAAVVAAKKPRPRRRFVRHALLVSAIVLAGNELWVGTLAEQLTGTVPHQELDTIGDLWAEYDSLAGRSLNMGLSGLEDALLQQTQLLADRVAENYKSPVPTVREAQWQMARGSLARAVTVRPDNARLRASLRYSDGHIHRINGEARKARRQLAEAQNEFTNAVASYREAAEFRPNWPDPFIGLMRTFIYGLDDVDRGADALKEAQKLGFTPGDREQTLLGDGYRMRADSLARMARQQSDNDREREYLTRAAEAYRHAISVYAGMVGVASAERSMQAAQRSLDRVERRLDDLSRPPRFSLEGLFRWP